MSSRPIPWNRVPSALAARDERPSDQLLDARRVRLPGAPRRSSHPTPRHRRHGPAGLGNGPVELAVSSADVERHHRELYPADREVGEENDVQASRCRPTAPVCRLERFPSSRLKAGRALSPHSVPTSVQTRLLRGEALRVPARPASEPVPFDTRRPRGPHGRPIRRAGRRHRHRSCRQQLPDPEAGRSRPRDATPARGSSGRGPNGRTGVRSIPSTGRAPGPSAPRRAPGR